MTCSRISQSQSSLLEQASPRLGSQELDSESSSSAKSTSGDEPSCANTTPMQNSTETSRRLMAETYRVDQIVSDLEQRGYACTPVPLGDGVYVDCAETIGWLVRELEASR